MYEAKQNKEKVSRIISVSGKGITQNKSKKYIHSINNIAGMKCCKMIQCVHEDKRCKFTTNEIYKIDQSDNAKCLYVKNEAQPPTPDSFFIKGNENNGYTIYTHKYKLNDNTLLEDCMEYALALMYKEISSTDHKEDLAYRTKGGGEKNWSQIIIEG